MDAAGRIQFGGNEVTDKFTCPVCNELPEETVNQCQNGHVICHKCYPQLQICPLCRCQLDQANPTRNLAVQSMLNELKVNCPFQTNGCETRMYRNLVPNHGAECVYNFQKFGQLVNLCQKLGYPTCNFKVNDGNTAAAIEHFQSVHAFHLTQSDQLQMELDHFREAITLKKIRYWTPVIVKLSAHQGHLIILPVQNEVKEFTCVSIWFPDSKNNRPLWLQSLIHVKYTVPQRDNSESCKLSFVQRPLSIAQADNILPANLPHSIKGQLLTKHMRDEVAMQIICKIKKTSAITAIQGPLTTFICRMNPPLQPVPSTGAAEKAEKWLKEAEDSSKVDRENLWTFLWELYEEKNNPEGYTPKQLDYLKKEAILLVLRLGTVSQLGYLRAKGCNLDDNFYDHRQTILHYILKEDEDKQIALEKVKALVNFGVDFKRLNRGGTSLLHYTTHYGNEGTVKYVVKELKLDVNALTRGGCTPLNWATVNEDENCAIKISQLLLDHGANTEIGKNLLEFAKPNYKKQLEKMLCQHREKNANNNPPAQL